MGGGLAANASPTPSWALTATRCVPYRTARRSRRLMLGFCAPDAASGVEALKRWVTALTSRAASCTAWTEGRQIVVEGPVYTR